MIQDYYDLYFKKCKKIELFELPIGYYLNEDFSLRGELREGYYENLFKNCKKRIINNPVDYSAYVIFNFKIEDSKKHFRKE